MPVLVAAVLVDFPPRRWIGAELATAALLQDLAAAGHDVRVHSLGAREAGPYLWGGLPVLPLRDDAALGAGLVVTHPYSGTALTAPVDRSPPGAVVAMMVHSTWGHVAGALRERRWDVVVPNAAATARALGLDPAAVVRPPVPEPAVRTEAEALRAAEARTIGFVNGAPAKGGLLLEGLIARGHRLLGVCGGWSDGPEPAAVRAASIPQGSPEELRERYWPQIAVHCQPSLQESWGMAALEALSLGVPVAPSDLPGIREALADVPEEWVSWAEPGDLSCLEASVERLLGPVPGEASRSLLASVVSRKRRDSAADRSRFVAMVS